MKRSHFHLNIWALLPTVLLNLTSNTATAGVGGAVVYAHTRHSLSSVGVGETDRRHYL